MSGWNAAWRAAMCACVALGLAACSGGGEPASPGVDTALAATQKATVIPASTSGFSGHGIWWNPTEGGSGFIFEAQGATGLVAVFTYEATGRPVWYSGNGSFTQQADGKFLFQGTLSRYSGGQRVNSNTPTTPTSTPVGAMTVVFDGETAQVQVPGRSYPARRFYGGQGGPGTNAPNTPETGIYWNPDQSGRGYVIEVTNNIASVGVYHYDENGEPTWNLVVGDIRTGSMQAAFTSYFGGQTLAGTYKAPTALPTTAQFTVSFGSACAGQVQFPGLAPVAVQRFAAGSLPVGAECRTTNPTVIVQCTAALTTGFARSIETTPANSGTDFTGAGDGGGGGDGGGAAAGGGLGKVLGGLMRVTDLNDGAVVGEAVTDSVSGLVTVRTCGRNGPFLVTLEGRAGAKYFDEGLNQLLDFPAGVALNALVTQWDEHVGVSPFTEAAVRLALAGRGAPTTGATVATSALRGITTAQAAAANTKVLETLNFAAPANLRMASVNTLPTPLDTASGSGTLQDSRYGISAAVLGGFVKSVAKYDPTAAQPALSGTRAFAEDMTDGVLNGWSAAGVPAGTGPVVPVEAHRFALATAVGQNAMVQQFGTALTGRLPELAELNRTPMSAGSDYGRYALRRDGSVTITRDAAVVNGFLSGVNQLSAGGVAAFAMKNDGTVAGWGRQTCGLLGNGVASDTFTFTPATVSGLRNVKKVAVNNVAAYALDTQGSLYAWGRNTYNLLGLGSSVPLSGCTANGFAESGVFTPRQIPSLTGIRDIATGQLNAYAMTKDGRVYQWGLVVGASGEPGAVGGPTEVAGVRNAVQIASTTIDTVALLADGSLMGWGGSSQWAGGGLVSGAVGAGGAAVPVPRAIPGFTGDKVVQIASDNGLSGGFFALLSTGEVKYWHKFQTGGPTVAKPVPGQTHIVTYTRNADGTSTLNRTFQGTLPPIRQIATAPGVILLYATNGDIYEATVSIIPLEFKKVDPADLRLGLQ